MSALHHTGDFLAIADIDVGIRVEQQEIGDVTHRDGAEVGRVAFENAGGRSWPLPISSVAT